MLTIGRVYKVFGSDYLFTGMRGRIACYFTRISDGVEIAINSDEAANIIDEKLVISPQQFGVTMEEIKEYSALKRDGSKECARYNELAIKLAHMHEFLYQPSQQS